MNLTVVTTTVTLSTSSLFEDKIRSSTLSPLVGSNTCCVRKSFGLIIIILHFHLSCLDNSTLCLDG